MSNHSATILEHLKSSDHSEGSARGVTVTLPRSRAPTVRSSARSARSGRSARSQRSPSGSEGEHGVPLGESDSQGDSEGEFSDEYEDDWDRGKRSLGRSESASSASNNQGQAPAGDRRRVYSGRHPVRLVRSLGGHRGAPQPPSPESELASAEDYGMDARMHGYYPRPAQAYAYARSNYSQGYGPQYVSPTGQQLVPYGANSGYGYPGYGHGGAPAGYYGQPPMPHHTPSPYEVMPQGAPGYFPYPQGYGAPPAAVFQYQHHYQQPPPAPRPAAPASESGAAAAQATAQANAGLEELKELFVKEKQAREEQEKKAKDALAQAQLDKKHAEEIKAAAEKAAADATTEAEKKAAAKAAEEEKKAAEDAALAALMVIPEEKKKPIKFKDAVGRKFNFPFDLCQTWEGMEDLIRQAFLHIDVIGSQVDKGHYDLIGPNNEIILPAVWETVIEPDWTITMHMWPMPEEEKAEDVVDVPEKGKGKGKGKGKDDKKGKAKPAAKKKKEAPAASSSKGDVPPPPPPAPLAPPGVVAVETSGKKPKKATGGFGLFGSKPKPKVVAKKK